MIDAETVTIRQDTTPGNSAGENSTGLAHAATAETAGSDKPTPPEIVNPIRADWSEWSADRERRRLESEVEERRKFAEEPIYPREIAGKIADDAARKVVPDWKLVRQEQRGLFVKLLKGQPELQQREVKQLDSLLNLIRDNLPVHMQPLLVDLRLILDLRELAHEAAAFFVGTETGRRLERQYVDAEGRIHSRRATPKNTESFRLHSGEDV